MTIHKLEFTNHKNGYYSAQDSELVEYTGHAKWEPVMGFGDVTGQSLFRAIEGTYPQRKVRHSADVFYFVDSTH